MAYYTLLTRDNATSKWGPQFGDADRTVVAQEIKDSYRDVKPADRMILKTKTKRQYEVNSAVEALNGELVTR